MVRSLLIAAAFLMLGAAKPLGVDYRLGVATATIGSLGLEVEIRLHGDADGETRMLLPRAALAELRVAGAAISELDARHGLLRHRPGARLTLRYRLRAPTAGSNALATSGDAVFAIPEGRADAPVVFRWSRLPKGWRAASDLDPGLSGPAPKIADIGASILLAGPDLHVAARPIPGGALRAAVFGEAPGAARLAEVTVPLVSAHRAFWADAPGPFLVAGGFQEPVGQPNSLRLSAGMLSPSNLTDEIARTLVRTRIPHHIGSPSASPAAGMIVEGLAGFYADRLRLRAGLLPLATAVSDLAMADQSRTAGSHGAILALKWDEEIRRKSGGKLDLDDVILRMADHYRRFPAGQGPDVVTGLVSAAWVTAGLDLRPDIARYASGGAVIPLPETMFDGCLDARVTVSPGFDPGFDPAGSFAARIVRGVRRGGPAWNSGLRNGMALERWAFTAGDMTREIELTVRPTGKPARLRKIRFWPYGDVDVETRRLQLAGGLTEQALAACSRKIGGL